MAYKIIPNPNVNQKDFVKAHMTKEEILGMEALQGHFTSIDKKTGLREFSHLIPIFKNEKVLNVFERLEDQLSNFGELSKEDLKKYKEAETKRPHYIETATETVMKKFGRGSDKHLVLLPKEIAEFFIKINKGKESRNPKTGYLEFARGAPERSGGGDRGPGYSYRTSSGGLGISLGSDRGGSPYQGTAGGHSGRYSVGNSGSSGSGTTSGSTATYRGVNFSVPVRPDGKIDFGALRRMRPDLGVQTTEYMMRALSEEQKSRDAAAAAQQAQEQAAAEQKSTMMSALQYGATILGFMLGGPAGASIGKMVGKIATGGMGGDSKTGGFTPDMPTRAAAAALSSMTGNPLFDAMLNKIGNKIADNIPHTPQEQLTKHLEGNLNYGMPGTESPDGMPGSIPPEGRRHHNDNVDRIQPLNTYRPQEKKPESLIDQMIKKITPQQYSYAKKGINQSTEAQAENPLGVNQQKQTLSPFQINLQKLKEKEEAAKRKARTPIGFEPIQQQENQIEEQEGTIPQLNIKNNSINPTLDSSQKQEAINTYMQRNPINKLNPFESRHSEQDLKNNAFREFFQNNPGKINPVIMAVRGN